MPSRRRYLTTLSSVAVAAVAGCVSGDPADAAPSDEAPTPTGTDDPTPTDSPSIGESDADFDPSALTVDEAAVQYSFRRISNVDWNAVTAADGQFVFVVVDASEAGEAPPPAAFSLVADGETHPPYAFRRNPPYETVVGDGQYLPDADYDPRRRGWLCFETPARLDGPPRLQVEHGGTDRTWNVPETERATAPPPAWEFDLDVTDTVPPDERFDIEIRAENVGEGPGVFRGAVNFSFPYYYPEGFDVALAAGERGSATVEATSENADPGTTLGYDVVTAAGEGEIRVEVAGDTERTATARPD